MLSRVRGLKMNNVKIDGEPFLPISLNDDFQDINDSPENQKNVSTINNSLKNSILGRNLEGVQICLQNGADPNIQFWTRKITALQLAIAVGSLEIIQNLLISGADVNMADSQGITPLHLAAENGMIDLVPCLINAGAKVNIQDLTLSGQTPLHRAATGGHVKVLEYLVSFGAQVNSPNARSLSPLQYAVDMGHINSVKFLLQNKADILVHTAGDTLLHICAQRGHASILELLLAEPEMLDNINSVNSKGHVPLHEAALRRTSECIQLLLKAGADLGAKTKKGSSATTLILESPNGTKILSKRLDDSINTNGIDPSDKTCEIVFDFSIFLSNENKQQMGVIKDVLDDPRKQLITDLIEHPLIELFLCLKWEKIRYFFFFNLIFYIIFMFQVTNYVSKVVSGELKNVIVFVNSENATDSNATETNQTLNLIVKPETTLDWLAPTLLYPFIIFLEIAELATLKFRYFKRLESWMKISVIITSMIVMYSDTPWPDWVHRISAATILLGWFQVNFLLGRFPTFGVYVLVFYSVAKNLMKFIGAYIFFLIGFSFTFYLIFTKHHEGPYDSPWTSPLRTLALMLGDHDYDKYMAEGKHNLGPMANVIYFFFLLLVSLILMNLLIGLAVNDIQELQKQSRVERLRKQAEFIIFFEKICTPRILNDSRIINAAEPIYPWTWVQKTQTLILSWITINSKLSVNPTKREFCYFRRSGVSSYVLERSLVILKSKQATENNAVNHDMFYNLLKECMASIESLRKEMGYFKYQ